MEPIHELQKSAILAEDSKARTHSVLLSEALDFARNHPAEFITAGLIGAAAIYSPARLMLPAAERLEIGELCKPVLEKASHNLSKTAEYAAGGFNYHANLQERLQSLMHTRMPVNYASMVPEDSKVVLFGETHPVTESREELIANMGQFKDMGFTHLALEALPKKRQPLIDAYFSGSHPNATREAVEKILKRDWGWDTPSYMSLVDEAKANGIGILSADKKIPTALREVWEKAGNYMEEARIREEQWAEIIGEKIENEPASRVLMLAGKAHVGIDPTKERYLTSLLTNKNLKPLVVDLDAPAYPTARDTVYTDAVRQAGLERERFAVPVVNSTGTSFRPSDFVVNLPPGKKTNALILALRETQNLFSRFELANSTLMPSRSWAIADTSFGSPLLNSQQSTIPPLLNN